MNKDSCILVAGARGLVGSALCRVLRARGFTNLVTPSRKDFDLTDSMTTERLISAAKPDYVFVSAAKVGGIIANSAYPVEFMTENLRIQLNVLESAKKHEVKKLLFLGSACAYPKLAENPIREDALLTGALEPSNECYALAKISGIKLCEAYRKEYGCDFISAMPTNLYGVGDHYDLNNSHVIPGMIRRIHEAKLRRDTHAVLWGTGSVTRDFLFSDDLAEACLVLMDRYSEPQTINIASGKAIQLRVLANVISDVVGFPGDIWWDATKPDGTPLREMDCSKLKALGGWEPKTGLREGLTAAYEDFLKCQQH
jgi:GDP-L-fucose synthase